MFITIYILLFALLLAYWFFTKNLNYWADRGVNGPKPLPLFGNLLDILRKSRTTLELNNYKQFGNFYGYYLGRKPVLVVGDPELIKSVLVKDFISFPKRESSTTEHPVMSKSLSVVAGEDWKRIRSITSPTFTSNKMKLMYPLMEKCLNTFMVHLDKIAKSKSNLNIKDIYGNLTLDVIAASAFATDLNSKNELDSLFVQYAREFFQVNPFKIFLLNLLPKFVFKLFGVVPDRRSPRSQDFYVGIAREIIANRRKSGQKFNDFLQLLIDADSTVQNNVEENDSESHHVNTGKEEMEAEKKLFNAKSGSSNKQLSEDEIIAQAVIFLMAGYETTATTLTYVTYELALNSKIQDKLYDEIKSSRKADGNIDYEVLCRLPYLDAVISETLRRHSPVAKISRIATTECKIGDTGITVYPGQQVDIPIYAIHHDEKYYSDPFTYNPERFMPENRNDLVPYTYLPFGGGPRNCIGMRFSLLETKLTLAKILQQYRFKKCDETDVPLVIDPKALLSAPKRAFVGIELRGE